MNTSLEIKHKESFIDWGLFFLKRDDVSAKVKDMSIKDVVTKLCPPGTLEHQKVKAIFNWVCHNIEYDLEALKNTELISTDPAEIFKRRKGVCCGYSCLFEEMCRVAGLECVQITGGCGENQIKGKSRHSWNAVRINKEWKLLDPTWAAGYVNSDRTKFFFKYDEKYFLTDPNVFIEDHFPDDSKWTLLPETNQVARGA
ncbi:UNVERIFIED_CONTAM: hypothetical protein FKN15_034190 [Acipenser sinensis]